MKSIRRSSRPPRHPYHDLTPRESPASQSPAARSAARQGLRPSDPHRLNHWRKERQQTQSHSPLPCPCADHPKTTHRPTSSANRPSQNYSPTHFVMRITFPKLPTDPLRHANHLPQTTHRPTLSCESPFLDYSPTHFVMRITFPKLLTDLLRHANHPSSTTHRPTSSCESPWAGRRHPVGSAK
jgi:hypothetical protein